MKTYLALLTALLLMAATACKNSENDENTEAPKAQTELKNTSPQELAQTVFLTIKNADTLGYAQTLITKEEIAQIIGDSEMEDRTKPIAEEYLLVAHDRLVLYNLSGKLLKAREEAEQAGLDWSRAELDTIIVQQWTADGVTEAIIDPIVDINGLKYSFHMTNSMMAKDGWKFFEYPRFRLAEPFAEHNKKLLDEGIRIKTLDVKQSQGMTERITAHATSNSFADWEMIISQKDGKEIARLPYKHSRMPYWFYTLPPEAGTYTVDIVAKTETGQDSQSREVKLDKTPQEKAHIWLAPGMDRVDFYMGQVPADENEIELNLAKNEKEGFYINILLNYDAEIKITHDAQRLPSTLYRAGALDIREPAPPFNTWDIEGWRQDILEPVKGRSIKAKKGVPESIYVEFESSKDSPAGEYAEPLTVEINGKAHEITAKGKIYDVSLPDDPMLKTAFSVYRISSELYPDAKAKSRETMELLNDHFITPDLLYRGPLTVEEAKELYEIAGDKLFANLGYIQLKNMHEWKETYLPQMKETVAWVRENNLQDNFYIYTFDEVRDLGVFWDMVKTYEEIQEEFPDIQILTTSHMFRYPKMVKAFKEAGLDHWCPLTNHFHYEDFDESFKWWYICNTPPPPFANWLLEGDLIESRIIFWQTWKHDIEGFLYWVVNRWKSVPSKVRFDELPLSKLDVQAYMNVNGDGILIYPGGDEILPSMRLKGIRDGFEDYALFEMAARKAGEEKIKSMVNEMTRSLTDYERDSEKLLDIRTEVLELLEE